MDLIIVPFLVGFFLLAYNSFLEQNKDKDAFTKLFTFVIFVFVATGLTETYQASASKRMQDANKNNATTQQIDTRCSNEQPVISDWRGDSER
ncbi:MULTISPECIES: hypothetical protein [Nostocales]|uniref:Uncharacterized protein n=3 Tax=Nostocales TaxID=1161 RepID=A0A0C1QQF3_9CYAN|nr:hypothetical protein [Tolypothrix bouteillei]KAF3888755.1 hypothetical protein DA73_0400027190 [Tolypothrix bouteillei VB521301]